MFFYVNLTLAWTAKMCLERWCFRPNCVLQTVHSKDFLFSWTDSMWRSRWSDRVNRLGHCWQAKALEAVLSSSCRARMCARRWCFCENFWPHCVQSNGRTFSCTAETCFWRWSLRVNLFWQTSHCQFRRFSFFGLPSLPSWTAAMLPPMTPWVVMASPRLMPLYLYSQCNVVGLNLFFFLADPPTSWMVEMWFCSPAMLWNICNEM